MRVFREWIQRLVGTLRPHRRDADLEQELQLHLELAAEDARRRGVDAEEVVRATRIRNGGVPQAMDALRDQGGLRWLGDAGRDVRYGLRTLTRAPGFTAVAILTLALGIGATTAIFSVIDAALLRPLPYPEPDRLVQLSVSAPQPDGQVRQLGPSVEDVRAWREQRDIFSHVTVWRPTMRPVVMDGPEPERVETMTVSEDYLALHGVTPVLGRGFTVADMREGAEAVVLLGYGYWQSRFGGDSNVIGQIIRVDSVLSTIVGVLPPAFYDATPLWQPLRMPALMARMRGTGTRTYARLQPGVSLELAQRRMSDVVRAADIAGGHAMPSSGVQVNSLYERITAGYWSTTRILAAAVAAILLIACINVAGLLLARGAARGPELAVRASLGAGRVRLVRQLLAESVLLSLLGAAAGALLAWIALDVLVANLPLSLPDNSPPAVDLRVLGFTLVIAMVTGTLFGLAPALTLSRASLVSAAAQSSRRHGSAPSRRPGQLLIAGEVALAILLLTGAGLMIRSFSRILDVNLGFDPSGVVTLEVVPVDTDPEIARQYYPAVVDALRGLPGIEAVGAVDHWPLGDSSMGTSSGRVGGKPMPLQVREYVPGYFEALGFRLDAGRFPSRADLSATLPPALVSASAAREMFPGRSAIGETFEAFDLTYHVLGVVRDVRHRGPLREIEPEVYLPFGLPTLDRLFPLTIVVRSNLPLRDLDTLLRQAAAAPGARVVVERIRVASDWFDDRVVTPRRRTVLLGLLAGLGCVLALVGIFGTTAYAVGRRTQELGVRIAIGARPRAIVVSVLRDALWPTLAGIIIGLGAAFLTTRVIESFLFDTTPTDPATFAAVAAAMAMAAAAAAWIPARRAASVDPVEALRAG